MTPGIYVSDAGKLVKHLLISHEDIYLKHLFNTHINLLVIKDKNKRAC